MKRIIVIIVVFVIEIIKSVKRSIELNKATECLFQTVKQGKTEFSELNNNIDETYHKLNTYKIRNIIMKGNEHGQLRANTIYAELIDPDEHLEISATLEYILCAIRDRNLNVYGINVCKKPAHGALCSQVMLKKLDCK